MCFSGGAAVFISYTTAWCVRTTSSTTFRCVALLSATKRSADVINSMVGALNKLPVAASGMVFFGDPVTVGSVSSVLTGFIAGLVYAVAKSAQSAKAKSEFRAHALSDNDADDDRRSGHERRIGGSWQDAIRLVPEVVYTPVVTRVHAGAHVRVVTRRSRWTRAQVPDSLFLA